MKIRALRLTLQTSDQIRAQSFGAVTRPELSSRGNPAEGGLSCPRIFGLTQEKTCTCGQYRGQETTNTSCESCACPLLAREEMRSRFGHIELPVPIPHPWCDSFLIQALPVLPLLYRLETPLTESTTQTLPEDLPEPEYDEETRDYAELPEHTRGINDLYQRVLHHSLRLRRLLSLKAPEIICSNEQVLLQRSIANLFAVIRERFVMNPVEKTVDFSGHAAVIADPEIELSQCGVPVGMALSLWRPFLFARLQRDAICSSLDDALDYLENDPEAVDLLQEEMHERPLLLLKSPAGSSLSTFALRPILVQGEAIRIHPLLAQRWSLQIDGERLGVHALLSKEAKVEANQALGVLSNLTSPLSGRLAFSLSKMAGVGLYALTSEQRAQTTARSLLLEEAVFLYQQGLLDHREPISLKHQGKRSATTIGRALLAELSPEIPFAELNRPLTSRVLSSLLRRLPSWLDAHQTEAFLLSMEALGVAHATRAGLSLCIEDLVQSPKKSEIVEKHQPLWETVNQQFDEGLLLEEERRNKQIDLWSCTIEEVRSSAMRALEAAKGPLWLFLQSMPFNPRSMCASLGFTRRGPTTPEEYQINEAPIVESLREGLGSSSYFFCAKQARAATLLARALEEKNTLSRRTLLRALQDVHLSQEDCGSTDGVSLCGPMWTSAENNLAARITGRTLAQEILSFPRGYRLTKEDAAQIEASGVEKIKVRSPLTCQASDGVCATCFGSSERRGVGYLAAQAFELNDQRWDRDPDYQRQTISEQRGIVKYKELHVVINKRGKRLNVSRRASWELYAGDVLLSERNRIPYGAELLVEDGALVEARQVISSWDAVSIPIIADHSGVLCYRGFVEGVTYREYVDPVTGLIQRTASPSEQAGGPLPSLQVKEPNTERVIAEYPIKSHCTVFFAEGSIIAVGDVLAGIWNYQRTTKRRLLEELLELVPPKQRALLAMCDGVISLRDHSGEPTEKIVCITADEGAVQERVVSAASLLVGDGDEVLRGDKLTSGEDDPRESFRALGERAAARYLLRELSERLEADGHFSLCRYAELLVREMLGYVKVIQSGDSRYFVGEILPKKTLGRESSDGLVVEPILLSVSEIAKRKTEALELLFERGEPQDLIKMALSGESFALGRRGRVILGERLSK